MPQVDMPMDELLIYQGRNPRPDDHDAYWDRALTEMRAVDAAVDLEPAEFTSPYADCFHMTFTGVGGARVYAKLLRPKTRDASGPALIRFHGYSGDSGDWTEQLPYVAAGFTVASMDCRGQGGRSEDRGGVKGTTLRGHIVRGLAGDPDGLLFRQIFLDTAQLAGLVMDMDGVDADRVGTTGGSQGGALALACASLEPRIRRAAPAYPFLSDYKRVWEMDLGDRAYEELRLFFRRFDPTHDDESTWFMRLGYIDIQHLTARIQADVLMAVTLMDDVCPPSTQYAAFNPITSPKDTLVYPDYGHEVLPGWPDAVFGFMMEL